MTNLASNSLMWRTAGAGELYAYIPKDPQASNLCTTPGDICNPDYGDSLGRGKFHFKTGEWVTVRQTIEPNAKASATTGKATVWINGKQAIKFTDLDFRKSTSIHALGIGKLGFPDLSWAFEYGRFLHMMVIDQHPFSFHPTRLGDLLRWLRFQLGHSQNPVHLFQGC